MSKTISAEQLSNMIERFQGVPRGFTPEYEGGLVDIEQTYQDICAEMIIDLVRSGVTVGDVLSALTEIFTRLPLGLSEELAFGWSNLFVTAANADEVAKRVDVPAKQQLEADRRALETMLVEQAANYARLLKDANPALSEDQVAAYVQSLLSSFGIDPQN